MDPLRVLMDDDIFRLQIDGGISRYCAHMYAQMLATPSLGVDISLPVRVTTNRALLELVPGLRGAGLAATGRRGRVTRHLLNWAKGCVPRDYLSEYDIIHHTYYSPNVLDETPGARRAVTVYDMTPEAHPEYFPNGNPHLAKSRFLERADVLLCISRTTRDELQRLAPVGSTPVVVAGAGVGPGFTPAGDRFAPGYDYVLHVGRRDGYKDFATLVAALGLIRDPELHLVCVGGGAFTDSEIADLRQAGLHERTHRGDVTTRRLAELYRGAAAFVFPSRHEGFGLPAIEALACGCPVVLADIPVFREVAQDAATYFPVASAQGLAHAIGTVRRGGSPDAGVGLARARDHSWDRAARSVAAAYRIAVADDSCV